MLLCCFTYKVLEHTRCVWAGHCLVSPRSMKFQPKRALSQQLYHSTSQGHAEQAEKIPFEKIPASKTIHLWNYAWSLKHKCKAVKLELSPHVMVTHDARGGPSVPDVRDTPELAFLRAMYPLRKDAPRRSPRTAVPGRLLTSQSSATLLCKCCSYSCSLNITCSHISPSCNKLFSPRDVDSLFLELECCSSMT